MHKPLLLIVDDELNNIKLLREVLQSNYDTRVALNGTEALERVYIEPLPELILLDVMMPGIDGYEVCRKIKSDPKTAKIPVIFVTAMGDVEFETRGFDVGGVDYIQKPFSGSIVRARIATHISLANQNRACETAVQIKTRELEENKKAAIFMLAEAGHYNDQDTGVHIWRMAAYSRALAQAADWPVDAAGMLELAAPMHDTGKIGIPDSVLKAPRKLTPEEWVIMKNHTIIGNTILSQSKTPLFQMAATIALNHHEKWAGGGYPAGITGEAIPEAARIVAIADVFDALTMKRPYKEAWPNEKAFEMIQKEGGLHFDPVLAEKFLSIKETITKIKEEWELKEKKE